MHFFKWYGGFARKMLACFSHFFVQNEESEKLLEGIGLKNAEVSGDTRFDRVIEIAEKTEPIPAIGEFIGNNKVIVAGSTWPEDEAILQKAMAAIENTPLTLIIAPHEIDEKHLSSIKELFPDSIKYSQLSNSTSNIKHQTSNVLIIDNIGLLSRLYKYGYITYVGGGFNKSGIHNILEAAVYGRPVLFGPHYRKFREAADLVKAGGAFSIADTEQTIAIFQQLINNKERYMQSCKSSLNYVYANKGATEKVLDFIYRNRLLIN
jgi:3-deoxy-D-manno-octulosonic-acid transferase